MFVESQVRIRSRDGVISNAVVADFAFKTPYEIRALIAEWPIALEATASSVDILRPRFAALSYAAPTEVVVDWIERSLGKNLPAPNATVVVLPEIAFELWTVKRYSEHSEDRPDSAINLHLDIAGCAEWLASCDCSRFYSQPGYATHLADSKQDYSNKLRRLPANFSEIFKVTYTTEDRLMVRTRFVQW